MNESELRNLMYTAQLPGLKQPFMIRYPRGQGVMSSWRTPFEPIKIGTGRKLRNGKDIAILSFGHPGNFAFEVCTELDKEGIRVALFDMRFVKPIDEELLHHVFKHFRHIITLEDGCAIGGLGTAVLEFMAGHQYQAQVLVLGVPDRIVEHGTSKELHRVCGFDKNGIVATVKRMLLGESVVQNLQHHKDI